MCGHMTEQIIKYLMHNVDTLVQTTAQHIQISMLALGVSACLGILAGYVCCRFVPAGTWLMRLFQILRVIPSLAILLLLVPVIGTGTTPALIALIILPVPPILMNTTSGLAEIPEELCEAARGQGMSDMQMTVQVRFPLAFPLIFSGIKIAAIEVIASATLAAKIGAGGLGELIFTGLGLNRMDIVLVGGLTVALLSLAITLILSLFERVVVRRKK